MSRSQHTILILEDNPTDAAMFQRYLEHDRNVAYTCYRASTAEQGLEVCRTLRPDAILLDYHLPDVTGLAFLASLTAEHGPLAFAVVMVTGVGNETVAVQALKLGAQDYLIKEYDIQQRLILAVASALDKVDLQRQVEQQRRDLAASNRQLQQALDAQQASEAQLRMALLSARMATWEWDLATNQVRWGEGLEAMLNLAPGQFGGSFAAFEQLVHPEDRALVHQRIERALQGGAPYVVEFRMLQPDGSLRWTETRGAVVRDAQGTPIRMTGVDMDVSDRKQAEADLHASEERYRALVTATSHIVWRTSAAGDSVFATSAWQDLTGQSESEMLGWGWMDAVHPDDRQSAAARWQQAIATETLYENEFRVRARDGSYHHFHARGVPILAPDGSLREWVGANTDITHRKQSEADLLRSEAKFKTLVEHASDVISRFDRDLRHLYVSPSIERATGLTPEMLIGKTNRELGMPADRCVLWDSELQQVFETGRETSFEFEFASPEGTLCYRTTLIPEIAADGTVGTVMTIAHDVTDYKRAEERLRFLSNASRALTASLDYQTTLEHIARLAIPYLGDACILDLAGDQPLAQNVFVAHIDSAKEALLRKIRSQYPMVWNSAHLVAEVLRTRQPMIVQQIDQVVIEQHIHDSDHRALVQELTPQSLIVVPLVVREQAIGVISLYLAQAARRYTHDDLVLAEELARRAAMALDNAQLYQEAQDAIREREDFLAIASHEVKTPLTTLIGRSQLLQRRLDRREDTPRERADVGIIIESGQRINQLLSELLDASRMARGQLSVDPVPLDLSALIHQVVAQIQPSAPNHQINIAETDALLTVAGDASRLEQVFQNLISNAIKYSPAGGVIEVELTMQDALARIRVRDQGLGIPTNALPSLFKRFYRVSRDSNQHIAGSGIGLYVVKEIVTGHGGTVAVSSTEGEGSTFTVYLPLAQTPGRSL